MSNYTSPSFFSSSLFLSCFFFLMADARSTQKNISREKIRRKNAKVAAAKGVTSQLWVKREEKSIFFHIYIYMCTYTLTSRRLTSLAGQVKKIRKRAQKNKIRRGGNNTGKEFHCPKVLLSRKKLNERGESRDFVTQNWLKIFKIEIVLSRNFSIFINIAKAATSEMPVHT